MPHDRVRLSPPRVARSIVSAFVVAGIGAGYWAPAHAGGSSASDVVVPVLEDFEVIGQVGGDCAAGCPPYWERVGTDAHGGAFAMHADDFEMQSDKSLIPFNPLAIPGNATAAELTFWHRFDFERNDTTSFDGGVLEVSPDDGQTWVDAGANITEGGYNGTIALSTQINPLAGRPGWVNTVEEWQQVRINLQPYRGESFSFRLRLGTDHSNGAEYGGWYVDDMKLSYRLPARSCARTWSELPTYPIAVDEPAAAGVGETLYVFGGQTDSGAIADAYKYSPQDGEWTVIASLPEARYGASAVTDGTYIYILGGAVGEPGNERLTATLWRYDPAANNYMTLPPYSTPTVSQGAAYLDGIIYRLGGRSTLLGERTASVEAYALFRNGWGLRPEMPRALDRFAALGHDGYLYTAGGSDADDLYPFTYRFDPQAEQWEDGPIADLPGRATTTGGLYQGTWVINADGTPLGWDPQDNRWRSLDRIPHFVNHTTAATAGNAFYVIGLPDRPTPVLVQQYVETACAQPTPTPGPGSPCLGDCGGDGTVGVAELVRGVGIALGVIPLTGCPAFDGNRDQAVGISELVSAVNNALNGCR